MDLVAGYDYSLFREHATDNAADAAEAAEDKEKPKKNFPHDFLDYDESKKLLCVVKEMSDKCPQSFDRQKLVDVAYKCNNRGVDDTCTDNQNPCALELKDLLSANDAKESQTCLKNAGIDTDEYSPLVAKILEVSFEAYDIQLFLDKLYALPDRQDIKDLDTPWEDQYKYACSAIKVANVCPGDEMNKQLLADTAYDCIDETACSLCHNENGKCAKRLDEMFASGEVKRLMQCALDAEIDLNVKNGGDTVDMKPMVEGFVESDEGPEFSMIFDLACINVKSSEDCGDDDDDAGDEDWDYDSFNDLEDEEDDNNLVFIAAGALVAGGVVFMLLKKKKPTDQEYLPADSGDKAEQGDEEELEALEKGDDEEKK